MLFVKQAPFKGQFGFSLQLHSVVAGAAAWIGLQDLFIVLLDYLGYVFCTSITNFSIFSIEDLMYSLYV